MRLFSIFILAANLFLISCAQLHHVQLGDIDSRPGFVAKPFEILVSETGINIGEVAGVSKAVLKQNQHKDLKNIAAFISLFQMGPRTGNPVYVKDYAKNVVQVVYEKCPSGRVTGLMSIRETRKYPVVSGEIVKIKGYCLLPRGGNS